MRHRFAVAAGVATVSALLALSAFGQNKMDKMKGSASSLSTSDKTFMKTAAMDGMAEVKLGEIASKQGASDKVKEFGQKMVEDHGKANDELKSVASTKSFTLPGDVSAKSKMAMARLEKLHGAAFDSAYIKEMKAGHLAAISLFQKEASKGKDADLKAFAEKTLPTIKEHYSMISSMGGSTSKMKHGKM